MGTRPRSVGCLFLALGSSQLSKRRIMKKFPAGADTVTTATWSQVVDILVVLQNALQVTFGDPRALAKDSEPRPCVPCSFMVQGLMQLYLHGSHSLK